MDIQQRYENLLSENKKLITEIDRLRQQLAEQTSGEPVGKAMLSPIDHNYTIATFNSDSVPAGTNLYTTPPSVDVLVQKENGVNGILIEP